MTAQKYNLFLLSPNNLGTIFVDIEFSCQNEEIVAEAVDIGNQVGMNGVLLLVEAENTALGTSANGATYMADGRGTCATKKDKTLQRWQGGTD